MTAIMRKMITAVVLVVALTVSAQDVEKGKLISLPSGDEMTFSFSGGKIISGGYGANYGNYQYEVVAGSIINFTCSHVKGQNNEMGVIVKKGDVTKKKAIKNGTASLNYTVPGNVSSFTVQMGFRNARCLVRIDCKVVKDGSQTKTTPEPSPQPKSTPIYKCHEKDSHIRFNDLYGEVKIRCSLDDDDPYEFAEIETVIYEEDLIKTEEESGAILGLEDMSTYYIGRTIMFI